jgi:hypothetical protein
MTGRVSKPQRHNSRNHAGDDGGNVVAGARVWGDATSGAHEEAAEVVMDARSSSEAASDAGDAEVGTSDGVLSGCASVGCGVDAEQTEYSDDRLQHRPTQSLSESEGTPHDLPVLGGFLLLGADNFITEIPLATFTPSLFSLDLGCNRVTVLSDGVGVCVNLTALDLRNNRIERISTRALLPLERLTCVSDPFLCCTHFTNCTRCSHCSHRTALSRSHTCVFHSLAHRFDCHLLCRTHMHTRTHTHTHTRTHTHIHTHTHTHTHSLTHSLPHNCHHHDLYQIPKPSQQQTVSTSLSPTESRRASSW